MMTEDGVTRILDRADVAISRTVDEHVEPPEGVDSRLDGMACCLCIGHVEGDGANLIPVVLHEIGELPGVTRRGDELVPSGERRFGERSAQATRTAGDQPDL
jgi:hypothetical protein